MTTLTITRPTVRTTAFERALLRTSAAVDRYVAARMERRTRSAVRGALVAREASAEARRNAQALGAMGMPPR
jgi:RecB family endonuclease NucS